MQQGPAIRVELLGPLQLRVDGQNVEVPGPKRRALLALLASAPDRWHPVDFLYDALWPEIIPDSAKATLQSHISRLRGHLGAGSSMLEGRDGAYRLRLTSGITDIDEARGLLDGAAHASRAEALEMLSLARDLWRGAAYAEFDDVPPLRASAVAADHLRSAIDEAYVEAATAAGRADEAVTAGTLLHLADPQSEPRVRALMRALEAAGRPAEALRMGYQFRTRLRRESGLDPTPSLADVETAIASNATAMPTQPVRTRPLIGRETEVDAIRALIRAERLTTLVGPGGVGKTALVMQVVAGLDDVTTVLLETVDRGRGVAPAVADTLGLRSVRGDLATACASLLAVGPRVLVLDNCEQVLADVAELLGLLLVHCPDLTVIATSRIPLGVQGECRVRVKSLPVTDASTAEPTTAGLLFIDCARRIRPDALDEPAASASIEAIVQAVDGLPLAIEVVASRLSMLDLSSLADRLITDGILSLDPDETVRRTIAWSYDLLAAPDQRLLRRLAAFPAGLPLGEAEMILSPSTQDGGRLDQIADASLVEVSFDPVSRVTQLAPVRAFAADVTPANERGELFDAVSQWALQLVDWIDRSVDSGDEAEVDQRLRREMPNLRAAWCAARDAGHNDVAVRLVTALYDAAGWRDLTDVWTWGLELVEDEQALDGADATTLLGIGAGIAWAKGELDLARRLAQRGLAIPSGDPWRCHAAQALVALSEGRFADAARLGAVAGEKASRPEQSFGVAALGATYGADISLAKELAGRLAAIASSPTLLAFHQYVLAEIAAAEHDSEAAVAAYEVAIDLARTVGATFVESIAAVGLLSTKVAAGQYDAALHGYRNLIDYWERTSGWVQQWTTLRNLADLLQDLGDRDTAALLRAAADRAPDAPPAPAATTPPGPIATRAAALRRTAVLDLARRAIDDRLVEADLSRSQP